MGLKGKVAVLIPIYKNSINHDEISSLKQIFKILSRHPIIFVAPESLDFSFYKQFCSNETYSLYKFGDAYFSDISGYNQLMLSPAFYKRFFDYEFILIHQLDAYVFKDDLLYWCKENYDFIGAPNEAHENKAGQVQFLSGYAKILKIFNRKISNVGNGGLSLRKTRTCYWLLKIGSKLVRKWGPNNEDGFFKYWGNIFSPLIRLPSDEIALKFSVEIEPAKSLRELGNKLPFGCHAYKKYDWATWQPFIK